MIVIKRTDADADAIKGVKYDPATLQDDGTDWSSAFVRKPWGGEIEAYRNEHCSVWFLHILDGKETSMHCHVSKTTTLFVLGGFATLVTLSGEHQLSPGDCVVVEKGAFHRTRSNGGAVYLYELEVPANKLDVVRLHDAYGRGQGYEKVTA